MRMAELIGGLDGPVYVERVALFDNKQRTRAKKAIKKALELQVAGKGFTFVEVLSECPTHLGLDPEATEQWVKNSLVPVFPLGVKKDLTEGTGFPELHAPTFDGGKVLGVVDASAEPAPRFATGFPTHIAPEDISLKLAGAGGDGAQTAAMLITRCAINEGYDSTHIPSYGPESRGGTSYADVHVAAHEVLSPASPQPHVLVAFNTPSLAKFGPTVQPGGVIVYDSTVVGDVVKGLPPGVKTYGVPCTEIARELGKAVVKNVVALGALQAATNIFPKETFLSAIRQALKEKCAMIPLNEEAFAWGVKKVEESR
jgi:2-oxoisovalerate ferredoxin oxidoreductase beta subunit